MIYDYYKNPVWVRKLDLMDSSVEEAVSEILTNTNTGFGSEERFGKELENLETMPSTKYLLERQSLEFDNYLRTVFDVVRSDFESSETAWVMRYLEGQGMEPHLHANSQFTSMLYLENGGGELAFVDPRGSAIRGYPSKIRKVFNNYPPIVPEKGKLVIIPSYLIHYVRSSTATSRMCLAMDFYLNEKD